MALTYDELIAPEEGDVEDAGVGAAGDGGAVPLGVRFEEGRLIGDVTVAAGARVQYEQVQRQVDAVGQPA